MSVSVHNFKLFKRELLLSFGIGNLKLSQNHDIKKSQFLKYLCKFAGSSFTLPE